MPGRAMTATEHSPLHRRTKFSVICWFSVRDQKYTLDLLNCICEGWSNTEACSFKNAAVLTKINAFKLGLQRSCCACVLCMWVLGFLVAAAFLVLFWVSGWFLVCLKELQQQHLHPAAAYTSPSLDLYPLQTSPNCVSSLCRSTQAEKFPGARNTHP